MAKQDSIWSIEPHTRAKHDILRRYLGAWFPIMGKYQSRAVFLDGFAGPGIYKDGSPGSPAVALHALLDHKGIPEGTEYVFLFNEMDPARYESLCEVVQVIPLPSHVSVHVSCDSFGSTATDLVRDLREANSTLAPTFAFIDPFGYKDIPIQVLADLLAYPKCELLVYLDLNSLIRFATSGRVDDHFTALMGSDEYRFAPDSGQARQDHLLHLYERQIRDLCRFRYTRSFVMHGRNGKPICALVYGTNNSTGMSRMKDAMWKSDPSGGFSYSDATADAPTLFDDSAPDTVTLQHMLLARFAGRTVDVPTLEEYVVVDTPYKAGHLRRPALGEMEKNGAITVQRPEGKRRNYFGLGATVTFPHATP